MSARRIILKSQALYSLPFAPCALAKQLPFTEISGFISVDHGVWSCRSVSVLVPLDVTDTDKQGIYSTLWFFSLLVSPKVNLLPVSAETLGSESELKGILQNAVNHCSQKVS